MSIADPEAVILKLLRTARPEQICPVHRVKRLITNGCKDARYLISSGWRFVLSEDGMTVLTVERVKKEQN